VRNGPLPLPRRSSSANWHRVIGTHRGETRLAAFTGSLQRITCLALLRGQYQTLWYHSTVDPYRSKTYPAWDRTLSHLSGKRKLIETMGREDVYRLETGSSLELLDIAVITDRLPSGLVHPPRRHNVTQTHGCSPQHARSGWGYGPEDGSYGAREQPSSLFGNRRANSYALLVGPAPK